MRTDLRSTSEFVADSVNHPGMLLLLILAIAGMVIAVLTAVSTPAHASVHTQHPQAIGLVHQSSAGPHRPSAKPSLHAAHTRVRPTHAQMRAAALHRLRSRLVAFAKKQIGSRYVAGGVSPRRGFDCSGLAYYVYKEVLHKNLPHTSHLQFHAVVREKVKQLQPGDLVFYFRHGAHHVGIYIGSGKMVNAVGYGAGVRITPAFGSWWSHTFSGVGRLIPQS